MPTQVRRESGKITKGKLNADLPQNPFNSASGKPPKTRNLLKPIETEYADNVTGDGSFENNKEGNTAEEGKQGFV